MVGDTSNLNTSNLIRRGSIPTRALIRRAVNERVRAKRCDAVDWGLLKQGLTLELRFRKKLHETPFYVNQELFYCIFVLWQWEKVSFSGMKQEL